MRACELYEKDDFDLPIKPAKENVYEVLDAQFNYGRILGDDIIDSDKLFGGIVGTRNDKQRVRDLINNFTSQDGYFERLIVDTTGNIIEGQHRYEAALELGLDKIPVTIIEDLELKYPIKEAIAYFEEIIRPEQIRSLVKEAIKALEDSGSVDKAIDEFEMSGIWNERFHKMIEILGGK